MSFFNSDVLFVLLNINIVLDKFYDIILHICEIISVTERYPKPQKL